MAGRTAKAPTAEPARSEKYTRRVGNRRAERSSPSMRPQKVKGTA